jgi:transposase-like protein
MTIRKQVMKMKMEIRELKIIVKSMQKEIKSMQKEIKNLKNPRCPICGSIKIIKRGLRYNQNGKSQKYTCKNCDYRFSNSNVINFRMKHNAKKIEKALQLRKQGKTLSEIAKEIKGVSRQTIHRWLHNFQEPEKEITIQKEQSNQFGKYKREFKIKI